MSSSVWRCDLALLPSGEVARDVVVEAEDGRFARVEVGAEAPAEAVHLRGLVLPGMADAHSHAFHRALRGRTHTGRGSFWSWREQMYALAGRLTPDTYLPLARAAFAEGVSAGYTTVGEFHYLHHGPDGRRYADPNEMGHVLVRAAREAGVRLSLLDTCYLTGGVEPGGHGGDHVPLTGAQLRFGDGTADAWAARVDDLASAHAGEDGILVGAAIHSVRAVPADALSVVAEWADGAGAPLHAHVSEQPAENEACHAIHGTTPTQLLFDHGVLSDRFTAVHATHLTPEDRTVLGTSRAHACFCPTTERDLADGIGPVRELLDAGARLTFGSDSRAVVDAFEEARATELHARLATLQRGVLRSEELLAGLGIDGHASLGFADAGRIEVGARADLVAVALDSVRTAGASPGTALDTVLFAGSAADVTDVVVDGRAVVRGGQHVLGDIAQLLSEAITNALEES
ncbi:formimidoylglutamate deiminase [Egicoccus sp. AB-alg6-2]|uniref:formimidoylglutamate deiminase n=1 Tax=Egicoccus sp. AB-alg6-2 TaxID=3242692 RepID=UPI00359E6F21